MVSVPDLELRGSAFRIQAASFMVLWSLLVSDEQRAGWEAIAYQNRFLVKQEFDREKVCRDRQDERLGLDALDTQ